MILLACSEGAGPGQPTDAGASPDVAESLDVQLAIQGINDQFYVVRGESTSIPFVLAGKDASRAGAVAAIGLAPGLTADPTFVSGPTSGIVVVHADTDAPPSDLDAELVTQVGGAAKFKIAVVGVDGSLDPSFGAGGILHEPEMTGASLDLAPMGDTVLVAGGEGTGSTASARVIRLLADGSLDSSFGTAGVVVAGTNDGPHGAMGAGLAVCADGTFVVLAVDTLDADAAYAMEYRALYFDASGAQTDDVLLPSSASSLACVGGSVVLAAADELVVVDAARVVHEQPLPQTSSPRLLAPAASDLYV
ncbi:MAG TPA: hypothetical protein VGH28_27760, partial [Polyangiaceae bacterium]